MFVVFWAFVLMIYNQIPNTGLSYYYKLMSVCYFKGSMLVAINRDTSPEKFLFH